MLILIWTVANFSNDTVDSSNIIIENYLKDTTKTDCKKVQILKAAWNCFVHYGFEKTTMDDIASSIGMKKASLYYYFEIKKQSLKK